MIDEQKTQLQAIVKRLQENVATLTFQLSEVLRNGGATVAGKDVLSALATDLGNTERELADLVVEKAPAVAEKPPAAPAPFSHFTPPTATVTKKHK